MRLFPFMSEDEFLQLHSDWLAQARGEAASNFLIHLGVPAFLIKLDRSGAWHEDMAGMDPLDPSQRRVDLIGCLEGFYKVTPTVKQAPWPGHRP
jgi:hypothetical protein